MFMAGDYVVSDVTDISMWKSIRKIVAEELDKFKLNTPPLKLTWKCAQSFSVVSFCFRTRVFLRCMLTHLDAFSGQSVDDKFLIGSLLTLQGMHCLTCPFCECRTLAARRGVSEAGARDRAEV